MKFAKSAWKKRFGAPPGPRAQRLLLGKQEGLEIAASYKARNSRVWLAYLRGRPTLATLDNGKVFLAVNDYGIVGLFADVNFSIEQWVLEYGQIRQDCLGHVGPKQHFRRSGTPGQGLNGAPLARLVYRGHDLDDLRGDNFRAAQMVLPIHERQRLTGLKWVQRWQRELLETSGIGYMCNTHSDRSLHNVRAKTVRINSLQDTQILVATQAIARFCEIISPYKNTDSLEE